MPRGDIYSVLERKIDSLRKKERSSEDRKVIDQVFDKDTLMAIYKLMTDGIIDTVEFPISTGKEGSVFLSTRPDGGYAALKIYRIATATFKNISKYIEGDPRFKGLTGSHRKIIFAWAGKEFRNLSRFRDAGVRVPEPITFHKNLLVMEYIGDERAPAPPMKEMVPEDPAPVYHRLVRYMELAYQKAELVHGDLSEYNVLMWQGEPVIIDCGQAVLTDHPNARDFLRRDVENINRYFKLRGVEIRDASEIMKEIVEGVR